MPTIQWSILKEILSSRFFLMHLTKLEPSSNYVIAGRKKRGVERGEEARPAATIQPELDFGGPKRVPDATLSH